MLSRRFLIMFLSGTALIGGIKLTMFKRQFGAINDKFPVLVLSVTDILSCPQLILTNDGIMTSFLQQSVKIRLSSRYITAKMVRCSVLSLKSHSYNHMR